MGTCAVDDTLHGVFVIHNTRSVSRLSHCTGKNVQYSTVLPVQYCTVILYCTPVQVYIVVQVIPQSFAAAAKISYPNPPLGLPY